MSRRPPPSIAIRLDDEKAEQVRRNHELRLQFGEAKPTYVPLDKYDLADGVARIIPHGLGREPLGIHIGPPRDTVGITPGLIVEVRDTANNRAKSIVLRADGYSVTITVEIGVYV